MDEKLQSLKEILPDVSRETFKDLLFFEQSVHKWQKHINLISPQTIPDLWKRHILDSVQIFSLQKEAKTWIDIGSGGGFPGIVLAIFLKKQENAHIDLIESNHKKASFLRRMVVELQLPAQVHYARIEDCVHLLSPTVVTARALASLEKLFRLCEKWLQNGAIGLFPKGVSAQKEIEEALLDWTFSVKKYKSFTHEEAVILQIMDVKRKMKDQNL